MVLQKTAVESDLFELLKTLMKDPVFENFALVGGTALALQLGHRKSIDIDLFTQEPFDSEGLQNHCKQTYSFSRELTARNTLKGNISGIKIDFMTHSYPMAEAIKIEEGIRIYGLEDIAAMKLLAISDNGTRLKDYIDIAALSTQMSLNMMLNAFKKRYGANEAVVPMRSLVYFDEIDHSIPIDFIEDIDYSWEAVENRILKMVENLEITFEEFPQESKGKGIKR